MEESEYNEHHPDTILAEAEAKRIEMEARAKLHPVAQAIYAFFEAAGSAIASIGCVVLIGIAAILMIVLCMAPNLIPSLLGQR
jgi:hypothetical protein